MTCPTCQATEGQPCVTKSGNPAKKPHANRPTEAAESSTLGLLAPVAEEPRETDKARFDRLKRENRAAYEKARDRKRALRALLRQQGRISVR